MPLTISAIIQLCADGTCSDITAGETCDPDAASPCSCDALPFVCAKQIDLYPACVTRFQDQYDAESECLAAQEDSLPQVDFTGPWFLACYIGLSAVTFLMLLWCAWNQRWASVTGSTVPLEGANTKMRMMMGEDAERIQRSTARIQNLSLTDEHWTQTGYKVTIVGMTLYYLVILTHLIIQFLLLALTVEYCEFYYFSCVISSNHCAFILAHSLVWCLLRCPTRINHHISIRVPTVLRRRTSTHGVRNHLDGGVCLVFLSKVSR